MQTVECEKFVTGMLRNIVNSYTQDKYGITILKKTQEESNILSVMSEEENEDGNIIAEYLDLNGIPVEIIERIEKELPELKKAIEAIVEYFENSFDSIHEAVLDIDSQLHSDKMRQAEDDRIIFAKRLRTIQNDGNDRIKCHCDKVSQDIAGLKSDLMEKVKQCNRVPKGRFQKKLIGGRRDVEKIRNSLTMLKESLPAYIDTVLLLAEMELYLGEVTNAKDTLAGANGFLKTYFPFEKPEENRMFTLTDDIFWIKGSEKYCKTLENAERYLNNDKYLIEMEGR